MADANIARIKPNFDVIRIPVLEFAKSVRASVNVGVKGLDVGIQQTFINA